MTEARLPEESFPSLPAAAGTLHTAPASAELRSCRTLPAPRAGLPSPMGTSGGRQPSLGAPVWLGVAQARRDQEAERQPATPARAQRWNSETIYCSLKTASCP